MRDSFRHDTSCYHESGKKQDAISSPRNYSSLLCDVKQFTHPINDVPFNDFVNEDIVILLFTRSAVSGLFVTAAESCKHQKKRNKKPEVCVPDRYTCFDHILHIL